MIFDEILECREAMAMSKLLELGTAEWLHKIYRYIRLND